MSNPIPTTDGPDDGGRRPGHAVVAGFGVPGRHCADWLARHGWRYTIVERNPRTVERCGRGGTPILAGDATDPAVLVRAGVAEADLLAVTIPDERAAVAVVAAARGINPGIRILARVEHVSVAFESVRQGADQAVVAEELVARELVRLLDGGRAAFHAPAAVAHE